MKKLINAGTLGGIPFYEPDLSDVISAELWAALQGLLSPFDADTEGLIISGCVVSANVGNFDMTAGVVYLNGEFMRIAAVTNQGFTKYIAPSTPTSDSRTAEDGTTVAVVQTKLAGLVGSAPGGSQYVTINTLTGADDRRWIPARSEGVNLRTKVVEMGDWDMDANVSRQVPHGLADYKKIRSISGMIRDDADTVYLAIGSASSGIADVSFPANISPSINGTYITVARLAGGVFDGTGYDSTSFNRGWLTITYEA